MIFRVKAAGVMAIMTAARVMAQRNRDGCVTDYDATAEVDYFPDKATVKYAQTFDITYGLNYKVLNITGDVYVLYQCGTPQPEDLDTDVRQYISIPVSNVSTGTTDHIPRIELLGHRDSIVAYTGDTSFIGSPCVDELVADNDVVEAVVFNETCGSDVADNELLMELGVEVAFGDSTSVGFCATLVAAVDIHNGVGIVGYLESGPTAALAQGESIKLFSLFYNEEAKANDIFTEIEFLWFCTKNNAQGCSLQLDEAPEVAWFPYVPLDTGDDAFHTAGSGWGAPDPTAYYAHAINNTGGVMLECPASSSFALLSDEEMLACFQNATVCVFAADYNELTEVYSADVLDQLACVQNERVYDITLSGQNAWFEAISVEPHVLMEDMVVALHGEEYDYGIGSYERLLLRDVNNEASNSGSYYPDVGTCSDPDAELKVQGTCDIIVDFATCDDTSAVDGQESPAHHIVPTPGSILASFVAVLAGFVAAIW